MDTVSNHLEFNAPLDIETEVKVKLDQAPEEQKKFSRRRSVANVRRSDAPRRSMRIKVKEEPRYFDDEDSNNAPMFDKKKPTLNKTNAMKTDYGPDEKTGVVLGVTEINGELNFVFKWKDEDTPDVVPSKEAKVKYPYAIIDFYESHMVWDTYEENVDDFNVSLPI